METGDGLSSASLLFQIYLVSYFADAFILCASIDDPVSAAAGKSPDDGFGIFGIPVARAVVELPARLRPARNGRPLVGSS